MEPNDAGLQEIRRNFGLGVYLVRVDPTGSSISRIGEDDSVVVSPPAPDGGRIKSVRLPRLYEFVTAIDRYRKDNDRSALDAFETEDV